MQVLEYPKYHKNWTEKIKCRACKALLLVERKDLYVETRKMGLYEEEKERVFTKCLLCENEILIDLFYTAHVWGEIPEHIHTELKKTGS